jgi:putative FmdB family regulatory protein
VPTYSYACTECDNRFDAVQSFSDDALTECPQCSGSLRKLFGKVGVIFKGSGFYRTDSRSGSNGEAKSETKSSSTSESSSDSSSAKSGETKPGESKSSGESKSAGESKASTASTPATVAS